MDADHRQTWHFQALDTWFFREARPFDTIGVPELHSVFPPPAPTVAGAVKALIGQRAGIDWRAFKPRMSESEPRDERLAVLGDLRLQGPFVSLDGEPLFPAPLFLLAKRNASPEQTAASDPCSAKGKAIAHEKLCRLRIGDPVDTDLGRVRLPELPEAERKQGGYKPLENTWLTRAGLETVLSGGKPEARDIFGANNLFTHESRLGIARDNVTRTVHEGTLYQTRHIRPCDHLGLLVGVSGLVAEPERESAVVRLGGEGRLASVQMLPQALNVPRAPSPDSSTRGLILILLTPADLDGAWYPPGATHEPHGEEARATARRWRMTLHGVELLIHSAVLGKPRREGGWQLAEGKPRRVEDFVPAGSAWYCTVKNTSLPEAIAALHGKQVGDGQKLGRGLLAVGLWSEKEGGPTA